MLWWPSGALPEAFIALQMPSSSRLPAGPMPPDAQRSLPEGEKADRRTSRKGHETPPTACFPASRCIKVRSFKYRSCESRLRLPHALQIHLQSLLQTISLINFHENMSMCTNPRKYHALVALRRPPESLHCPSDALFFGISGLGRAGWRLKEASPRVKKTNKQTSTQGQDILRFQTGFLSLRVFDPPFPLTPPQSRRAAAKLCKSIGLGWLWTIKPMEAR